METPTISENRAETHTLLGGRIRLRQAAAGYRAGMDAALLAAACDVGPGERALEAGCGVGAVMLQAAFRRPQASFVGVEADDAALALATENTRLNGLEARVEAIAGDVGAPFARLGLAAFDAVLANPPFFDDAGSIRGPAPARRGAWIAAEGLGAWLAFLSKAVREGGSITLIHRADRLSDILFGLQPKAGSFQVRPVHPFTDAPAKRVLVRAIKTGRAPLRLLPPLVLHERDSAARHTSEADAILRGEADLAWLR
ncbi:MAG: methyltransferase [Caulobacteraceae bacterium]|nr:methyltransferase [Caulobacteraceae bacterium]